MVLDDIIKNFEKINKHFGLDLYESNKCFRGKCPIHNGDNKSSLTIYKTGHTINGAWVCFTGNCHAKYGKNLIGFVRGILSVKTGKELAYSDAVEWCEEFFGGSYVSPVSDFDTHITSFLNRSAKEYGEPAFKIKVKDFLKQLDRPQYFINRGYEEKTLYNFNVGYCNNPLKPLYERIIVPQLDSDGDVIACMGRSIYEKCEVCSEFHNPKGICRKFSKWRNSDNFPSYYSLYNFFDAQKHIEDSGIILITESSPNVWRLHEAGFPMSVATFGSKFSDMQKKLLDTLKVGTIIVVPDAGKPGKILVDQVEEHCKYTHNIVTIQPCYIDDVGALNVQTVKKIIGPYIDKCVKN